MFVEEVVYLVVVEYDVVYVLGVWCVVILEFVVDVGVWEVLDCYILEGDVLDVVFGLNFVDIGCDV